MIERGTAGDQKKLSFSKGNLSFSGGSARSSDAFCSGSFRRCNEKEIAGPRLIFFKCRILMDPVRHEIPTGEKGDSRTY